MVLESWMTAKYQNFGFQGPSATTNNQTRFIRIFSSTRRALFLGELEVVTTSGRQIIAKQNTTTAMLSFPFSTINNPNRCIDGNLTTFCIIPANPTFTEFVLFDLGASFDVSKIIVYPPTTNLLGLVDNPIVQTIASDGSLLSTSTLPTTQACSSIAISFPTFPNGTLFPVPVSNITEATNRVRYIYIRNSESLNIEQINVFGPMSRINVTDATFSSQWIGTPDIKPPTAANCVNDFIDGGCSSDFIAGSISYVVLDLGGPVQVAKVGSYSGCIYKSSF